MKFKKTGNLGVLFGRGRKLAGTEFVEEVATAVGERTSSSIYSSANGRSVSRDLENPWSTVRKILQYILKLYSYKIYVMQTLKPQGKKTRPELACRFLARMKMDDS
ncbi:hypothetical protein TNCV_704091 [Trichonephila clavipes]|nr:hypothetical protein TNCV_704091 [Trichonephila clavipes]